MVKKKIILRNVKYGQLSSGVKKLNKKYPRTSLSKLRTKGIIKCSFRKNVTFPDKPYCVLTSKGIAMLRKKK